MRKQESARNPLFAKRSFSDDIIILCVRCYLRFRLSYRNLASIVAECGIAERLSIMPRRVHLQDLIRECSNATAAASFQRGLSTFFRRGGSAPARRS